MLSARRPGHLRWTGLVIVGLAVLLAVAVPLPWVRVTGHFPPTISVADPTPTLTVAGIGHGPHAVWGWLTLVCGVTTALIAAVGGVLRNGRLMGAAAIPGLVAFGGIVTMAIRLRYATPRSTLPDVAATLPQSLRDGLTVSVLPGSGWHLALSAAWLIIGAGTAVFVLNGKAGERLGRPDRP